MEPFKRESPGRRRSSEPGLDRLGDPFAGYVADFSIIHMEHPLLLVKRGLVGPGDA